MLTKTPPLPPLGPNEARVVYAESDYKVVAPGKFVRCAVTGQPIPLDELKYWSFARQEPYVDAHASLKAEQAAGSVPASN